MVLVGHGSTPLESLNYFTAVRPSRAQNRKNLTFMPQIHHSTKLEHALNPAVAPAPLKGRRKKKKVDPTQGLQVVNPHAAAVDIGAAEHWVAIPPGRTEKTVRCFGCTTAELKALADWLQEHKVRRGVTL